MCTTKTPKVSQPIVQAPTTKKPVYMRNSYLDGLGDGAESGGRSSLRIDPGSARPRVPVSVIPGMGSTPVVGGRQGSLYMGAY